MEAFAARQLAKRRAREQEGKVSKEMEQDVAAKNKARKVALEKKAKDAVKAIDIKMTDLVKQAYEKEYKSGRIGAKITFKQQASLYALAAKEKERIYRLEVSKLEEVAKEREEELLELEKEEKAAEEAKKRINYFEFNKYDRKIFDEETTPIYLGDYQMVSKAWYPSGKGKIQIDGDVKLEGDFAKGFLNGQGRIKHSNGKYWEGSVRDNQMHGYGNFIEVDEEGNTISSREALARSNLIVCYRDQLRNGIIIEFQKPIFNTSLGTKVNFEMHENRKVKAIVLGEAIKDWIYTLRFHDSVWPKDREVDLNVFSDFKVRTSDPTIYHINSFGCETLPKQICDYREMFQPSSPNVPKLLEKLEHRFADIKSHMILKEDEDEVDDKPIKRSPVNRPNLKNFRSFAKSQCRPEFPLRHYSEKLDSVFEGLAAGIGAAQEEEEMERRAEMKKKQFAKLIEERRAAYEAKKQKEIEDEQSKSVSAALEKSKAETAKKKAAEDEEAARQQKAMEDEIASIASNETMRMEALKKLSGGAGSS